MNKAYSESCVQNRQPIFDVISEYLKDKSDCLEIGSGTGQHAVYFASDLPHIDWQTSDRQEYHQSILAWLDDAKLDNLLPPLILDVLLDDPLGDKQYSAIYSANTVHIMGKPAVKALMKLVGNHLQKGGVFMLYGPFNYDGQYTSDSNRRFDLWLEQQNPESCIKDFEWLHSLALEQDLTLINDHEMPANNRLLVWQKS